MVDFELRMNGFFFNYVADYYRECAGTSPCFLVGDFNQAAYEESIPNVLRSRSVIANLLGRQGDCICCYSLGVPMNMNTHVTQMDTSRWCHTQGGMHEPLLLHLGNRPVRSEHALAERKKKRDERNASRSDRRKVARFR